MIFNFNSNSPFSYIKYAGYCGKYKGKEYYMCPRLDSITNILNHYDVFEKIESALVDLLNVGRLCTEDERENVKFTTTMFFVENYGLLGFMAEAPVNPDFMLDKEIILKDGNVIDKKCVIKTQDYFKMFFPFASDEEMSYSIEDKKVVIETNSDLQKMLSKSSINQQLIYSSFYCEQIDWIVDYAKKMYKTYKNIIDLQNVDIDSYEKERLRDVIKEYSISGVPYKLYVSGDMPKIEWKPNSLKQALDMSFGFIMSSEKNPIKECKHCGKIFNAKNPKAEYCSSTCRNRANVYKSREKNK